MTNYTANAAVLNYVGLDNVINGELPAYAWPGGYPIFYVTESNEVLCPAHANVEGDFSNETIIAADVNWEDIDLYCAHGERIESAYGEDAS